MADDEDIKHALEEYAKKIKKMPTQRSNQIGRPKKYNSPKDMQKAIDAYFDWLDEYNAVMFQLKRKQIPPTIADLIDSLGFSSRSSWYQYRAKSTGFMHVIDAAKNRIAGYMERIVTDNTSIAHFWLRRNVPEDWSEPNDDDEDTPVPNSGDGSVNVTIVKNYGKNEDDE